MSGEGEMREQFTAGGMKWRFAVDQGGTFTDVVGLSPEGEFRTLKLLSSSPDYPSASIEGIRRVLDIPADGPFPLERIEAIRFGTTVATNALLERKGGRVALLISKGFRDLLEIGYQSRPYIFALCIEKPEKLYDAVFEVDERIDPGGEVITPLKEEEFTGVIRALQAAEVDAVAVVFMHAWKNPVHELFCAEQLGKNGLSRVFLSHKTMNLIKMVTRGQSAVMDAYLSTVIGLHLEAIQAATGAVPIEFMLSSGGLTQPASFKGKDALLSGPAGGVIAVADVAEKVGAKGVIGFDMGGTSTDVSRYEGEFDRVYERVVGGVDLQTEMLNIVTVASGGGSILWFDGQRMRVGPESGGADPGPACYGFGGPLTVTDANLLTGRIITEYFPKTFGADRQSPVNADAVHDAFRELTGEINGAMKSTRSPREAALGFLHIANEKMAMAIKEISVSKGFDVRDYALVCFGGAGGQHACQLAALLNVDRIVYHPLGSVMSAYGIGLARPIKKAARTILEPYSRETHQALSEIFEQMEAELASEETGPANFTVTRQVDLRHQGTDTYFTIPHADYDQIISAYKEKYKRIYGFYPDKGTLEVVNLRIEFEDQEVFFPRHGLAANQAQGTLEPVFYKNLHYYDGPVEAPVYLRESLPPDTNIPGPAYIVDRYTTFIVDRGFEARVQRNGIVIARRIAAEASPLKLSSAKPDPVLLEVFSNLFMAVATEMGHTLRNTAHSVNIKERLDFSCAVFDAAGGLIANAPHIPVHLGSMGDTVKALLEDCGGEMKPGDLYLTNNPYKGGSHLPDTTVVCPLFSSRGEFRFFTAVRGHHADMGGIAPGSMPAEAEDIAEEGVLIDNLLLVRDGVFQEKELTRCLCGGPYPVRNFGERVFDLQAQIAACQKGVVELQRVIRKYGWEVVRDYMGFIQANAAFSVKQALCRYLQQESCFNASFEDRLDDGTPVSVKITIKGGETPPYSATALIDFTGTGPYHERDNLNTPLSVTRSAVLYVLRTITGTDIPLNSGCLEPIDIVVPEMSILNPPPPAPVASGNVETSQRIVDVLLGALQLTAASQGTMNNLLFQLEEDSPYYETIAGGAGGMEGCPGASGVQVHMTNTRITDPEILEVRHPGVRLNKFTLRRGSGGEGRFPGGDGVIREVLFLKPATVSIISERRVIRPYGLAGGGCGERGENLLRRASGEIVRLPHRVGLAVAENDSIIIKTPGGGGYGR
jgi:5-oxoprolinase (ATP-hydrolysing)